VARWRRGCDGATSISGNGAYRDAAEEVLALATCAWRGHEFTTIAAAPRALFAPTLPASYAVRHLRRTWTGRAIEYRWRGGGITVEARTSLPGPLLRARGTSLALRWPSGAEPGRVEDLDGTLAFDAHGLAERRDDCCWIARSPLAPVLIVASRPIRRVVVTSHLHWTVDFVGDGGALLIAPLLGDEDIPRDAERRALWRSLARRPPLQAEERFRADGDTLTIAARFPGSRLAPVPPMLALLGDDGGLLTPPAGAIRLMRTWCGPFDVVRGSTWTARVATGWMAARWTAQRDADTEADLPDELAYAGDATWEPGTAMDQLLALRTWAPLVAHAPPSARAALIARLTPPTAAQLRAGVEHLREPVSRRRWARLRQMWDHVGDACYDVDWYNGLALSGLARAAACAVPAIAVPAAATARACRRERAALAAYFTVFNDWALGSAWTDPRGWLWNADCVHNGLEGLLGEARLREDEGNTAGAADLRYVAVRTAVSLRAALELPRWLDALRRGLPMAQAFAPALSTMTTWSRHAPAGDDALGRAVAVQALTSWRDVTLTTPATRNCYLAAGAFPEWNALLAAHVDRARLRALATAWEDDAERYRDWIAAYIGEDWRARHAAGDQEARVAAATFYLAAPEVALRRFVLGETPAAIERRFATPLGLAERILLRAGFSLASTRTAAASA